MNTNKAQKEVFNALLLGKGCTSGFFLENNENNPMFVTTNGYVGYIFQPESIMFNVGASPSKANFWVCTGIITLLDAVKALIRSIPSEGRQSIKT